MSEILRREFLLGTGALLLSACRVMSQIRAADHLVERPQPEEWHPVMRAMVVTVLPFEHPAFPRVTPEELLAQMRRLFQIDEDPDFENLPKALMLFDDAALMGRPPAPFVDDERRDLVMSRVPSSEMEAALSLALERDRAEWSAHVERYGESRFVERSLEGRRAYLSLWGESSFITRRRFYRGVKAMVSISAYSMKPFWDAVGYRGPLLGRG